jgi:general secretion pathway protein G
MHARGERRSPLLGAEGFTLIELPRRLVVYRPARDPVAPNFIGQSEKAKPKAAVAQLQNLRNALDMFQLDGSAIHQRGKGCRHSASGPDRHRAGPAPTCATELPLDPWGRPYVYRSPGEGGGNTISGASGPTVARGVGNNADIALSG